MKIGLLISGGLGNLLLHSLRKSHRIVFVMTDTNSKPIIEDCSRLGIDVFTGNPRANRCTAFIANVEIDVLVSVNYLFLIEKNLIELPKRYAFNVHGSLLPKYRGRTPHVWAIINNEKKAGVTAHLIDEGCDTGDIIEQITVDIEPSDTGATLLEKYSKVYPELVSSVLGNIEKNNINPVHQNNEFATYFGKRTPNDGKIDWNWSKERIYNWIRAQAPPYPGAFSFYENKKVIVKSSSFSEYGFDFTVENGTILSTTPLTVKTPNGAMELNLLEPQEVFKFEVSMKMG